MRMAELGAGLTLKAPEKQGSNAAEPDRWQCDTYKLLGEHPRSIRFMVFVLGLLKWLHCNGWVYACIGSTMPSQH